MALPSASDLRNAVAELREIPKSQDLARVATQLFLERIELFTCVCGVGEDFVDKVSTEAGLELDELSELGEEALESLAEGREDAGSATLASAFLALGIQGRLEAARSPEARRQVVRGFVEHLDWLEASSALAPYRALSAILEPVVATDFWRAVATTLVEAARAEPPEDPTADAQRQMLLLVRASALARAPEDLWPDLREKLASELEPSELRRIALAALTGPEVTGGGPPESGAAREPSGARDSRAGPILSGALEGRPWSGWARFLAAITGILLIRWLLRLGARYLLGLRREATVSLTPTTLTVDGQTQLLGRRIRERHTTRALQLLAGVAIERRFRYLHLLIGALGLVLGLTLGVNFLVEGACAGYPPLALFGLTIIGGGILLDVLLEVLVPNRQGVVTLVIDLGHKRVFRIRGVDRKAAQRFVDEASQLIPPPKKRKKKG